MGCKLHGRVSAFDAGVKGDSSEIYEVHGITGHAKKGR
jgi:hypothetical protein